MRVNMEKWSEMTRSCRYSEWHPLAKSVCKSIGKYPTADKEYQYHDIFTFFVKNKCAKNSRTRILNIGLTNEGKFEYFTYKHDTAPKPIWYVEEVVAKIHKLYEAFEGFGLIRR